MTRRAGWVAALLAAAALAAVGGCASFDSGGGGLGDGFVRSNDTRGTGRRVDVFGGSNAPVLPTIGAPGFGK